MKTRALLLAIIASLIGCTSPQDLKQHGQLSFEDVGLPEAPPGLATLTAMEESLKPAAVNGRSITIEGSGKYGSNQSVYRIFLEPGFNCVTLAPSLAGGFIIRRDLCFDAIRAHDYTLSKRNDLELITDETTARPILYRKLRPPEEAGSARLVWSHLRQGPGDIGFIKGATLGSIYQGDRRLKPSRKKSENGEKIFEIEPGYQTFSISYSWKSSLLSDPIVVFQMVSLDVQADQFIRVVSGERGVSLLDAKTNRVLRDPR